MKIGVIGTGAMGSGMAANLIKAGHDVTVWDRTSGKTVKLVAQGATRAETPADAFGGDAVITMLANDEAVRAVIVDGGVLGHARNTIHVISSTISVAFAQELEDIHRKHDVPYVAAPVLGRPDLAESGALNALAAGQEGAVARVTPLLHAFAKQVWPVGPRPHQANAIKLACNFVLAAAIEAMAEASVLAERHGVAPAALIDILTGSLFASPAYKTYGPAVVGRKFEPAGFPLPYGLKDIRQAMAAAENAGAPMPFAAVVHDNLVDAMAHGDGQKDWSAFAAVAWRRAGLH